MNKVMNVAIQGQKGSFHHQALTKIIPGDTPEIISCDTFAAVFKKVSQGEADAGLVAIENNLYGSINEVYRLLQRYDMWISQEIRMSVGQCLITATPISLDELASYGSKLRILSQAPALAQVEYWLDKHLPGAVREETHDTAASVEYVMDHPDDTCAIAGVFAAEQYGAHVVAADINDDKGNYTRFVLFTNERQDENNASATSLILTTDHSPGALYKALGYFTQAGVNLTKLDSHPIPGDAQHYAFYIDTDHPVESEAMQRVIDAIHTQPGCSVKLLGSYRRVV